MSQGRSQTATKYHTRLASALSQASLEHKALVLKTNEIVKIYERCHGVMDEKIKKEMQPSDHCDRTTAQAVKGTGRCSICEAGAFLLERVNDRGTYRIHKREAIASRAIIDVPATVESAVASRLNNATVASAREYEEGKRRLRYHRVVERNRKLVADKKSKFKQEHGYLVCEVCSFDFASIYGPLGEGYAECHHTTPMAQVEGVRISRVADLAVVCANCHRMLHRPPFYSVDDLRALVGLRRESAAH